jgi:membrane protein dedA family protein
VLLETTTAESLTGIAAWAVGIMTTLGGPGAAFLIALENLFPPLPSEVILPLAGFSAGTGTSSMTILTAILWCTFGSVAGAWALYGVGAWLGPDRTRRILAKVPLVKTSDIDRTEAFFHRRGGWTVFTGRMVPVFRSLISIPAGVTRMNPLRFTLLTMAGAAIWNTILVSAGYALGANWSVVEDYVGIFSKVVIAACVVALAWFIAVRLRASRRVTTD